MGVIYGNKNVSKQKNIIGDNVNKSGGGSSVVLSGGGTTATTAEFVLAQCIATSNIALDNTTTTIDGYTLLDSDIILVQNQTTTAENGIYEYSAAGNMVLVIDKIGIIDIENGTTYAGTTWGRFTAFETVATYNQIGAGGGGGTVESVYVDAVYRNYLTSLVTAQPDGYSVLLTNQSPSSANGYYVATGGTFVKTAHTFKYFIVALIAPLTSYEIWVADGASTYISQNTFTQITQWKSRNNFVSNYNAIDTDRNNGELGAFVHDGQSLQTGVSIGGLTPIFIFNNIGDLSRIATTANNENYENMQLKFSFRLELLAINMGTGFNIIVSGAPATYVAPNKGLLTVNLKGWNVSVTDIYTNLEDYSANIIIQNPSSPGFEDVIVTGEFFFDMPVDSNFSNITFAIGENSSGFAFDVAEGSYINWQIANMETI